MKKIFNAAFLKQFFSYVCVGGIASIVEWVLFAVFSNVLGLQYLLATALSYIFSTAANWFLGRIWTFRASKTYENKRGKELFLVFLVSAIGLLFNWGLMYLFVTVIGLDTPLLKTLSKIAATGIVFFWNFLIRKFVIYKL